MGSSPQAPTLFAVHEMSKYNEQTFYTFPFLPTHIYLSCSSFSTHLSLLKLHSAEPPVINSFIPLTPTFPNI